MSKTGGFLSALIGMLMLATWAHAEPLRPQPRPLLEPVPITRWDHRAESTRWSRAALAALRTHGQKLVQTTPSDIGRWCPGYSEASEVDRRAFWTGLLSALAKHESTWNPRAVGGGGRWFGLTQIDPRTARAYGCAARTGAALKDGAANLSCAVRIATRQVSKRGTVRRGMLDWGPFHSPAKRAEMAAWVRVQPYCAIQISPRPLPRPLPETLVFGPRRSETRPAGRPVTANLASAGPSGSAGIVDQRQIGRVTTAQ